MSIEGGTWPGNIPTPSNDFSDTSRSFHDSVITQGRRPMTFFICCIFTLLIVTLNPGVIDALSAAVIGCEGATPPLVTKI